MKKKMSIEDKYKMFNKVRDEIELEKKTVIDWEEYE